MKDFGVDNINVTKSGEEPEYNVVAAAWNVIQTEFECCGTDGYEDWTNTTIMGVDSKFNQYLDVRFFRFEGFLLERSFQNWRELRFVEISLNFRKLFQSVGYKKSEVVAGKCDPNACPQYPVPDSSCKNETVNCGWTYADDNVDKAIKLKLFIA